jgi:hypothetical protein
MGIGSRFVSGAGKLGLALGGGTVGTLAAMLVWPRSAHAILCQPGVGQTCNSVYTTCEHCIVWYNQYCCCNDNSGCATDRWSFSEYCPGPGPC